jgi:hypothetical protein
LELATIKNSYLIWEASKVIRSSEKNPIPFAFKSVEIRAFGLVPSMTP